LQEAYLTVDYERGNFSVHPCTWDLNTPEDIMPIRSPAATNVTGSSFPKVKHLSGGAIAEISIGMLVLGAIGVVIWLCVVESRPGYTVPCEEPPPKDGAIEVGGLEKAGTAELEGPLESGRHEAEGDTNFVSGMPPAELMSSTIHELVGSDVGEMSG
jgi:hypothetical protein